MGERLRTPRDLCHQADLVGAVARRGFERAEDGVNSVPTQFQGVVAGRDAEPARGRTLEQPPDFAGVAVDVGDDGGIAQTRQADAPVAELAHALEPDRIRLRPERRAADPNCHAVVKLLIDGVGGVEDARGSRNP